MQLRNLKDKTAKLIRETSIEIAIGAGIGLVFGVAASYMHEDSKRGQIPLAFSEIGQTKRVLSWHDQKVPPLTMFYSVTNDVAMKVFEASNKGYAWSIGSAFSRPNRIAYEMEKKIDPSMRFHTQIPEYAAQMPEIGKAALQSILPAMKASMAIKPAIVALDKAWDEYHSDVYRTETYTEQNCSTDGKGNRSCTTEVKTRQVYDHTIHTYTYHKNQGELASQLLNAFQQAYPSVHIDEELLLVPQTNAENEEAMRNSRKNLSGYEALKGDDYLKLTNVWATGSNYHVLMPRAEKNHAKLLETTPVWGKAKNSARSHRYTTYSHSDSGPREFRIAEAALEYAQAMAQNIDRTSTGIALAQAQIPLLSEKIKQFVNVELHGAPGNSSRLLNEIMYETRAIYDKNFAGGFDTQPFKWY
ncbi:MAG: hypothetical protein LRY36_00920, partial [Alphaproteobacteria bacterium]|nr:hypothetical protein [Alphaproteobacteria bacterium]